MISIFMRSTPYPFGQGQPVDIASQKTCRHLSEKDDIWENPLELSPNPMLNKLRGRLAGIDKGSRQADIKTILTDK